ncbi:MAG: DegT/DnrJ/EryC1/StrS family aminotransferase [Pirellulaceae bacterium]|nr:DegT/DnrJ/EryC1/StrS family aminotransferase [Pirellulaceae bacterium]
MSKETYSRRAFVKHSSLACVGAAVATGTTPRILARSTGRAATPAILGGTPVRKGGWSRWPIWIPESDEPQVLKAIRSGVWSRRGMVAEFEKKWAEIIGAKRCMTTVNGTNALITAIKQLDIGGRDEVIVTPYTWIATTQAILQAGAMPVFADVDPQTYQIDPDRIEEKITSRTKAILPVHILGLPADMERIMAIAKKHNLLVVEDCCQAWLAEINHQKVGTFGNAGCFSFQNSKHLAVGEGGAIVSDDEQFMDRCYSYHNMGLAYGSVVGDGGSQYAMLGSKVRWSEYQAAVGLAQLPRLEMQTTTRNENADFLRAKMSKVPGIVPHKLYDNVTRAAYHLFPFQYQKQEFKGLSRVGFIRTLRAEGVPCSEGYNSTLNSGPYLRDAFQSKNFQLMYPKEMLDFDRYVEQNQCPKYERLCQETIWLSQSLLLGNTSDMDDIVRSLERIHENAEAIKSAM